MKNNLPNIIEGILFLAGDEISADYLADKLGQSKKDIDEAVAALQNKYSGECGINLLVFNGKIQLASNPLYVDDVSAVLNPIREKELTKAMLETLSIIAYKQPITRLEVEDVRGVDCNYALQTLIRLNMIAVVGRKDAVGKPLLFATTDEFLKRFSLTNIKELPDYADLLERIHTLSEGVLPTSDFYNSNRDINFKAEEEEIPDFLAGEVFDIIKDED